MTLTGGAQGPIANGVGPDEAILLSAAWLVAAIAVACVFTDRAEISG